MLIFAYSLTFLLGMYFLMNVFFWVSWHFIPYYKKVNSQVKLPYISVIIPVRNEAENILYLLQDLAKQSYQNFEVFVVNDFSSDKTVTIVENFSKNTLISIQLLHLNKHYTSPKKAAITLACQQAKGQLIVTTDGDCRVGNKWLENFAYFFAEKNPMFISAGVSFIGEKNIFEKWQTIEFGSLIGAGAVTLFWHFPTMANGANMAFSLEAFQAVQGYAGTRHIPSGDDEFLLHKISSLYPKKNFFLKNTENTVYTYPKTTLNEFISQRKRWASKWQYYQSYFPKMLAIFIFLCNFGVLLAMGLYIYSGWEIFAWQLFLKLGAEFFFLAKILKYFKKTAYWIYILPLQLLYPLYVVSIGFTSQKSGYHWKGRFFEQQARK